MALPVVAQPESISLDAFDARLAETLGVVAALTDPIDADGRAALAEQAEAWRGINSVALPDGRVLPVLTTAVSARLSAADATPQELRDFLDGLQTVRRTWTGAGHSDADLDTLARILAQSKYAALPEPPAWSQWLYDLYRRLINWLRSATAGVQVPDLSAAWLIGLSLALAALLIAVGWRLRRVVARDRGRLTTPAPTEVATADEALDKADSLAAAGDLRQAVRLLYLATLLALEEQGALRFDRALTNHEVLQHLRNRPDLAAVLAGVIDVFDRVWYGEQTLSAESFATYAAAVNALRGRP